MSDYSLFACRFASTHGQPRVDIYVCVCLRLMYWYVGPTFNCIWYSCARVLNVVWLVCLCVVVLYATVRSLNRLSYGLHMAQYPLCGFKCIVQCPRACLRLCIRMCMCIQRWKERNISVFKCFFNFHILIFFTPACPSFFVVKTVLQYIFACLLSLLVQTWTSTTRNLVVSVSLWTLNALLWGLESV